MIMHEVLSWLNEFLYSNILLILLVAAGIYFSIRTRFVQIRLLKEGIVLLKEKAHNVISLCQVDTQNN